MSKLQPISEKKRIVKVIFEKNSNLNIGIWVKFTFIKEQRYESLGKEQLRRSLKCRFFLQKVFNFIFQNLLGQENIFKGLFNGVNELVAFLRPHQLGHIGKSLKGWVDYLNLGSKGTQKLLIHLVLPGQKWTQVNYNSTERGESNVFAYLWTVTTPPEGDGSSLGSRIIRFGI